MTAGTETAGPPASDLEYLAAVARAFGLGGLARTGDLGTWGDHRRWRVRDGTGRSLLLKEAPSYLDRRDTRAQEAVHECLAARGAPVVALLAARHGRRHATVHGRRVALQAFAPGSPVDITDHEAVSRFGVALGRLAMAGVGPARWPAGDWSVPHTRLHLDPDVPVRLQALLRRLEQAPLGGPPPDSTDLADLRQVASAAVARLAGLRDLPVGFVHADANPFNCLDAGPDGSPTLVDLDDARWGVQLFDLAQAVVHAAGVVRTSAVARVRIHRAWHRERIEALLRGYESVRALTADERAALPPYVRLVTVAETVKAFELELPDAPVPADLAVNVNRLSKLLRNPVPLPLGPRTGAESLEERCDPLS